MPASHRSHACLRELAGRAASPLVHRAGLVGWPVVSWWLRQAKQAGQQGIDQAPMRGSIYERQAYLSPIAGLRQPPGSRGLALGGISTAYLPLGGLSG